MLSTKFDARVARLVDFIARSKCPSCPEEDPCQDCVEYAEGEIIYAAGRAASGGQVDFALPEQRALTENEQRALRKVYAKLYKPAAAQELSAEQVREFAQQFGRTVAYTASIHLATTQKAQSERVAAVLENELNALLRSKASEEKR